MSRASGFERQELLYACISIVVGVCIVVAFRKFVAVRSHSRNALHLSLETGTYLVAALTITSLGSYKATTAATYMEAIKWAQVASIVSQISLIWLVARFTRVKLKVLFVSLTGAYLVALLMHITSASGLFLTYLKEIYLMPLPWGEGIIHPRVAFNFWRAPIDLPNAITLIAIPYACWRQYQRKERTAAILVGVLAIVILAANLHDMFVVGAVYLAPFGLLVMLAVFWSCPLESPLPAAAPRAHPESPDPAQDLGAGPRIPAHFRKVRLFPWVQHPLFGVAMAMLLVTAAQALGSNVLNKVIVLLALMGMTQTTIGVLYSVGSGKSVRRLAIVALFIIGLSQFLDILHGVDALAILPLIGTLGQNHEYVQDWLWVFGVLLVLSAFYLAGIEAGDTRDKLDVEHRQLVAEVAERRRAERELRKSEKRFRALIEHSTDIVSILAADGTIRYVGASVQHILGYAPETLVGKSVVEFCHPDDLRVLEEALQRITTEPDTAHTIEIRIRCSDGAWRVVEGINKNLLSDPVLNGIVVNARDITERKLMAERLESVKADEQQRIRHDLHDTVGQDLTGLLCMAGGLSKKLQGTYQAGAVQAEAIVEGVRRTMDDVRKAIQGIAPVEADPRGLEIALGQLVDRVRTQHAIDVRFECFAPAPILDYGAATQMFRIGQEALNNAIKHAHASKVTLSLLSENEQIALAITDNGVGINGDGELPAGIGLHTMRSRAAAIGATLRISDAAGGSGARVECVLAKDRYLEQLEGNTLHDRQT